MIRQARLSCFAAALAAVTVLAGCATQPAAPRAAAPQAAAVQQPNVTSVSGEELRRTGKVNLGDALKTLVPAVR
jgi:uncharacterized lipoprotein YajG